MLGDNDLNENDKSEVSDMEQYQNARDVGAASLAGSASLVDMDGIACR